MPKLDITCIFYRPIRSYSYLLLANYWLAYSLAFLLLFTDCRLVGPTPVPVQRVFELWLRVYSKFYTRCWLFLVRRGSRRGILSLSRLSMWLSIYVDILWNGVCLAYLYSLSSWCLGGEKSSWLYWPYVITCRLYSMRFSGLVLFRKLVLGLCC